MYTCPVCFQECRTSRGLTHHQNSAHRQFTPESDDGHPPVSMYEYHPHLTAKPCNVRGEYLPLYTQPEAVPDNDTNPWSPFQSCVEFDFANYHFVEAQTSASLIDKALDHWAGCVLLFGGVAPWKNSSELYATIDAINLVQYQGPFPPGIPPKWITQMYELCTCDLCQVLHHQLRTTTFKDNINLSPYCQFDNTYQRTWSNLMSADWTWAQADKIVAKDQSTHGAMFVPVVAGSDKTTVSVATGHQEYHPVYMSPGNLTNIARRSHGNALLPVAFLPIPKTTKKYRKCAKYQVFCRQMYHVCLAQVFEPLKAGMSIPEVVKYYPEQVWLAAVVQGWCPKCDAKPDKLDAGRAHLQRKGKTKFLVNSWDAGTLWTDFSARADVVPFTNDFPRANIHELLSPDLLHQVIKGVFKDHFVEWVNDYLVESYGDMHGQEIIANIDHRYGDDSKALMKVYLGAIAGHVPTAVVKCLSAFLDFCYIVHRNAITATDLNKLKDALEHFHHYCEFFIGTAGVKGDFISLPCQHLLCHYIHSIHLFGSPNGLCSSITESKHIKAIKEPWAFAQLGMMEGTTASYTAMILAGGKPQPRAALDAVDMDEADDRGPAAGPKALSSVELARLSVCFTAEGYPKSAEVLAFHIKRPRFPELLCRFLYDQLNPNTAVSADDIPLDQCPVIVGRIHVFHSAVARFFAPSDLCGAGGMHRERICSNPNWRDKGARNDTVFVQTGSDAGSMKGMTIGQVCLLFSFASGGVCYPCAMVEWFTPDDERDNETGMWVVRPEFEGVCGRRMAAIIHLDCISRAAHLIPVFGSSFVPGKLRYSDSLDVYHAYFVNNYIDHHSHRFLS
ncbi:hypothetical protein DFH94DRAFT_796165 [Russula ochroleuca]|uniref:C2H2-type domain-containing protein n=1 Tax=Russula ochroleuca TaxID=152965 RepID=A0A9P5MKY9_9AGAM|nr:hypothetical protein DFH94DRAFT_796165 [Russula ochroleuca]